MRYRKDILMAGGYTLLTILLTYPVSFRLTGEMAGFKGEDNLQWRWFLWWFKHALLTLQTSVADVAILFAPTGGQQPLYLITSYIPALALPLTLLSGPTLAFNLSFLLSFALSGYTTYLLAYYLTQSRPAAWLAGLIFAFYPARFGYGTGVFLGQLTTYFLPLYVLALFMLARRPSWRRAVWAALGLTCLSLTWPLHVAYGVVVFTLPFLGWQALNWLRRPETRRTLPYFGLAFGLAAVLLLGPYISLLQTIWQGENKHLGNSETVHFALDLLAFVTPSNYHPVLQPLQLLPGYVDRVLADRDDIQERLAYIGLVPALLAGAGLLKFRRRLLFWLSIALGAMLLSLGPLLKFNGHLVQLNIEGYVGYVVLPYALLRSLPILDWSGVLGRLNVATMLCIAVMAAYGVKAIGEVVQSLSVQSSEKLVQSLSVQSSELKNPEPRTVKPELSSSEPGTLNPELFLRNAWRLGWVAGLSVLTLFEFLTIFPFPTEPGQTPDFYAQLRQAGLARPQMIIDLPLRGEPAYNNYAMHYQTVHQQPMVGGHFMRTPAGTERMKSFIYSLLTPPLPQAALAEEPGPEARLGWLNQFGFTQIVARRWLMKDTAATAQLAYLTGWLGEPRPVGEVSVFELPPGGTPLPITPLLDGPGWQPLADATGLQLQAPADLLVYLDAAQVQPVLLQVALAAPEPERYLSIDWNGQPAMRLYLRAETLHYNLPLSLPPGVQQFTLRPEEACQHDCAPVNFSHLAVVPAPAASPAPVTFGDQVTLTNYHTSGVTVAPGQPVLVYLYWQGQDHLAADYSAFVHLVSASGELVGQADYLLGGWLYPTSAWPAGQVAAAPSLFFIPPDAAPGPYQLRAGIYRADTGERLRVSAGAEPQDSTLLATITIRP